MKLGLGSESRVKEGIVGKDGPRPGNGLAGTGNECDFLGFAACEQGVVKEGELVLTTNAPQDSEEEFAAGVYHCVQNAHIVVEGAAFLYNMVRIIVGTLVDVGRNHKAEGTMVRALSERSRVLTGTTAPAQGLCLDEAELALPQESSEPWPL